MLDGPTLCDAYQHNFLQNIYTCTHDVVVGLVMNAYMDCFCVACVCPSICLEFRCDAASPMAPMIRLPSNLRRRKIYGVKTKRRSAQKKRDRQKRRRKKNRMERSKTVERKAKMQHIHLFLHTPFTRCYNLVREGVAQQGRLAALLGSSDRTFDVRCIFKGESNKKKILESGARFLSLVRLGACSMDARTHACVTGTSTMPCSRDQSSPSRRLPSPCSGRRCSSSHE